MREAPKLLLATLLFSSLSFAFDFSSADAFFKNREGNFTAISDAKASYRKALTESRKEDKIYAAQQLGKLAYYEGDLLLGEKEHTKRVKIFEECMNDMEHVNLKAVGKNPTYYLFKAMCLGLWGKSKGMFAAARRVGELKSLIQDGLSVDADYDAGGLSRLYAAVYIQSKLMGLYDLEGALKRVNRSIELGPNYYNSYLIKAEVLKEMGKNDEAIKLLTQIDQKIRSTPLPVGLEPETKLIHKLITDKLARMQGH